MVTANLYYNRQPSTCIDSDDDKSNIRQIQTRLVSCFLSSFDIDKGQ